MYIFFVGHAESLMDMATAAAGEAHSTTSMAGPRLLYV